MRKAVGIEWMSAKGLSASGLCPYPPASILMYWMVVLLCCQAFDAEAQTLWWGSVTGGANYQGELRGRNLTAVGSRWISGTGLTLSTEGGFAFGVEYQRGMLSGLDAENPKYLTRRRNLHFETVLHEVSLTGRQTLLRHPAATVVPYVTAGAAAFHVDPYTFDEQGKRWQLFPLSTEGQGLPGYPGTVRQPRLLLSLPIGLGLETKVSRRIRADIEFVLRKTFTDRIDDVSGAYPDENLLLSARGFKAVELSYRSDELIYESPYFPAEGTMRGNPASKDAYYSLQLRIRYAVHAWSTPLERVRYLFRDADWPYRF
jgi:hypothetical protein